MEIRVDFDALMDFGKVYRTLGESLERRGSSQLDFQAETVHQVIQRYGLEIRTTNGHFAGHGIVGIRDDAVARSQRVANYLTSCSTDLFQHAGAQSQIDNSFDWSGASWIAGAVWDSAALARSVYDNYAAPTIGVLETVFKQDVPGFLGKIAFPLDVLSYIEALETIQHDPLQGWVDGLFAGFGITTGLVVGAKVIFGAASVATLAPALAAAAPYVAIAAAGVAAFEFSRWATRDLGMWLGGHLYDGGRATIDFVTDTTDALVDFGGGLIDTADDLWDSTVDFGKDAWNWAFGSEGVVNEFWDRAVDAVDLIDGLLINPMFDLTEGAIALGWNLAPAVHDFLTDPVYPSGPGPQQPLTWELLALSPDQRAARIAQLTDEQWKRLLATDAGVIGNLDGVPYDKRFAANREAIKQAAARAMRSDDHERALELWDLVSDPDRNYLVVDLAAPGGARIAEVHGQLDEARNVVVVVPGIDNELRHFSENEDGHLLVGGSRRIYDQAEQTTGGTAVVAWLGYDAPRNWGDLATSHEARAREGAAELHRFLAAHTTQAQNVSVVAHSYGSTTAGIAASTGLPTVDNLILLGSPGGGADHVSEYRLDPSAKVYAWSSDDDPVQRLATSGAVDGVLNVVLGPVASGLVDYDPLGKNPNDRSFGAIILDPGDHGPKSHGNYLEDGPLLNDIAEIVAPQRPGQLDLDPSVYDNLA